MPVRDLRPRLVEQQHLLVRLLSDLSEQEWSAPTKVPGWTVRDLALHVLHDDVRWLSTARDGDRSGLVDMQDPQAFVQLLNAKNEDWVRGAQGLSSRVVAGLLAWTADQVESFLATQDLRGESWVSWASDGPVPFWFNVAQEFTERWVHQHQIREAVQRIEGHEKDLPEVVRTFVWALPHQYRVPADAGTSVEIVLDGVGVWTMTTDTDGRWRMAEGPSSAAPIARMAMTADVGWRLFTGATVDDEVHTEGPSAFIEPMMRIRAAIV